MTAKETYYYELGKFQALVKNISYMYEVRVWKLIDDLKKDWWNYVWLLQLLIFSEKDKYELMDDYDSFYEKYCDDIDKKIKKVIKNFSVDSYTNYNHFDDYFDDMDYEIEARYKQIHKEEYSELTNEEFVIEYFYYKEKKNEIFNLNKIYYLYAMDKIDIKSEVKELWEFMKKYSHLTADEMYDIYCNGENVKDCDERFGFNHFIKTFVAYLKQMDETELIYSNLNESLMKYYNDDKYRCLFSDFTLIKENDKEYFDIDRMIRIAEQYKILDYEDIIEDYSKKIIMSREESRLILKEYEDKYSDYNHDFMGLMCDLAYDYCNESSKKLLKKI